MRLTRPSLRPFSANGYEIHDDGLAERGEVVIRSAAPWAPVLGDSFIIESGGHAHDVAVCELIRSRDGGWIAVCKVRGWV